jgi:hypothetical protein
MIRGRTISRRRFILAAAGLGLYAAARSVGLVPAGGHTASMADRLADLPADRESARIVGLEYLRSVPSEASPVVLTARLTDRLPASPAQVERMPLTELQAMLIQAIDEDLRDLDTVRLQGWILARTEARLYALAAV